MLAHRRLGNIATDEHFTRYDLQEAVRRVRALHNLGLHNADGHHDNEHISDLEWQDPMYDVLDRSLNLEQSLGAYLDGADNATDAAAQTHGVVLPYGQLPNSPAFAAAVDDRLSDAEYNSRLRNMTKHQRQVLTALGQHVQAGQDADPLRWFITGGAGVGKSFVISMITETLMRLFPADITRDPVRLTASTGMLPCDSHSNSCLSCSTAYAVLATVHRSIAHPDKTVSIVKLFTFMVFIIVRPSHFTSNLITDIILTPFQSS